MLGLKSGSRTPSALLPRALLLSMIAAAAPEAIDGAAEVISDLIVIAKASAMLQAAVAARPFVFMFTVAGEEPVDARADVVLVGATELEASPDQLRKQLARGAIGFVVIRRGACRGQRAGQAAH